MNLLTAIQHREYRKRDLSKHDWIILPIVGLATVFFIFGLAEFIARRTFTATPTASLESCMVLNDLSTGAREVPNSVCWEKSWESPLVEYKFNSCGDRAGMECGPKPPGTYRIVLAGSSFSIGKRVDREKSFAALLPVELSRETGRNVELYNEGILMWGTPRVVSMQMDRILAAHPDLILIMLSPWDIDNVSVLWSVHEQPGPKAGNWLEFALSTKTLSETIEGSANWSRAVVMLKEFFYLSESQYVKSSLMQDRVADMLKAEPTAELQSKLNDLEVYIGRDEDRAKAAGVPLAVVFVPNRAQAAMIAMGHWPAGYDPYKLGEEIRAITTRHGATYIDIVPDYRNEGNPERGYYPIDGHPNVQGSEMLTKMLAKELTNGSLNGLKVDGRQTALENVE
jgi:hypothetical protein